MGTLLFKLTIHHYDIKTLERPESTEPLAMSKSADDCGSAQVMFTDSELEMYKVFVDCTPLDNFSKAEMKDLRDPKLQIVQEASMKGISCESLVKPSNPSLDMQIVPWVGPSVPIEAVPLQALAPKRRQSTKKAKEKFQLPPGWRVTSRVRANGDSKGRIDKSYWPPNGGKALRSLNEVKKSLGII